MPKAELLVALGLAVDETIQPKFLDEAIQLTRRRRPLHQIDEVSLYAPLGEESKCFACVGALFHAEYLNFHRSCLRVIDRGTTPPFPPISAPPVANPCRLSVEAS